MSCPLPAGCFPSSLAAQSCRIGRFRSHPVRVLSTRIARNAEIKGVRAMGEAAGHRRLRGAGVGPYSRVTARKPGQSMSIPTPRSEKWLEGERLRRDSPVLSPMPEEMRQPGETIIVFVDQPHTQGEPDTDGETSTGGDAPPTLRDELIESLRRRLSLIVHSQERHYANLTIEALLGHGPTYFTVIASAAPSATLCLPRRRRASR